MAFIGAYLKDGEAIREKGFLFGFNNLVWVVVANQVNLSSKIFMLFLILPNKISEMMVIKKYLISIKKILGLWRSTSRNGYKIR